MKKEICGALLAACLMTGTVMADSLTLPLGESLPLGPSVKVWRGSDSFLAGKVNDWLKDPALLKQLVDAMEKSKIFPQGDTAHPKEVAELSVEMMQKSRAYQLQSDTSKVFYQAIVFAMPLTEKQKEQIDALNQVMVKPEDPKKDGGQKPEIKTIGGADGKTDIYVDSGEQKMKISGGITFQDTKSWKKGVSSAGVAYRYGSSPVTVEQDGVLTIFYVTGILLEEGQDMTYVAVLSSEGSGRYFEPFLIDGLKKAVKGL